ncbi:archaetidylserine decarboxylase [Agaribacterium haliotis]|uniref:archaetidylserine decarboxylase n=1 Tax=Agaribacterium haliotis TaxID=2013869 RepID=UPI0023D8A640|nr:archaetidylserine decarboxylase [Agaribacterium haliotis]
MEKVFIFLQYCLPQHALSRLLGHIASSKNKLVKGLLIRLFKAKFAITLDEAERKSVSDYHSFNDFFCRALEKGARNIDPETNSIVSPADGCFSQLGSIENGRIFQAKGQSYSAQELLADSEAAEIYQDGEFATIYLSPKDYHRVHMPCAGTLKQMSFVPGKLFSVNQVTAEHVPRLFARNERLVCHFDTEFGPMAMVLVGAMVVASIETTWAGTIAPAGKNVQHTSFAADKLSFDKGEEMGRFKLGSTVILLFPKNSLHWQDKHRANSPVRMGEKIAELINSQP